VTGDPVGALRLALWGGDRMHWPGYEPWRDVVLQSRRQLLAAARALCLLPEILPPIVRDDVALLHAFCRHLDDTVDEAPNLPAAAAGLTRLGAELRGEAPARPLVAAILAGALRMGFPAHAVHALLDGMRGDLGPVRMADDADLVRYCYRVSASVGLILCPVLGIGRRGWPRAVDLGIALQLTNIVLGVREDAGRDRVYLPRTRLARWGLTPEQVLRGEEARRTRHVVSGMVAMADRYYRSADEGARDIPWRYRHGVLVMSRVYGGIGRRAGREGSHRASGTASPAEKALRLAQVLAVSLTPRMLGLTPPPPHEAELHAAIAGWPGTSGTEVATSARERVAGFSCG
jgi:phytoene synthase